MKSIATKILAGLITFCIGWSCAHVRSILLPRTFGIHQTEAEETVHDASIDPTETVTIQKVEALRPTLYWDGYVKRGKINVRVGGSVSSVNGVGVSHTEEMYETAGEPRYILSRMKGEWHSSSEIAPGAVACKFKVLQRKNSVRIAWVSGTDLHLLETSSYSSAIAILDSWGEFTCE